MTPRKTLDFLSPAQMLLALGPAPAGVLFLPCVSRRRRLPLAAGMAMYALAWLAGRWPACRWRTGSCSSWSSRCT